VFINDTAIDFFSNQMILVKLNAEVDSVLSNRYHAKAFPTSLLLRKNGDEIDRLVGFAPTQEYLQTFVDYSNGIGTLEDLLGHAETETDRTLYLEIANKYKYRGIGDEAKNWFVRVIEAGDPLDSLSGEARIAFADFYRRAKEYDKALAEYQRIAEEFAPPHGRDAVIWQAIVYRQMGDTAQAIGTFESFIERFPDSEDREYAEEQIEKLKNPPEESVE